MSIQTSVTTVCDSCQATHECGTGQYHPIHWAWVKIETFTRTDAGYHSNRAEITSNYCPTCVSTRGLQELAKATSEYLGKK